MSWALSAQLVATSPSALLLSQVWRRLSSTLSNKELNLQAQDETKSLLRGLNVGRRDCLARAITLVESTNRAKSHQAKWLLAEVEADLRRSKTKSFRLGLSGPPGAGKSTFIETLGGSLTANGHKVAVLAVDPSSGTTGGSLLADKTRMPALSRDKNAYIRPSPNRGHLGGVTRTTNEAILLCEAAGFDIVLVETVGVGQSEYLVADMVDMFCLLIPPAGGDEMQGLKRGIVEQSDLIIVNKCDGDLVPAARRIKSEYTSALKYMRRRTSDWRPKVKMMSCLTQEGLGEVWKTMEDFREVVVENGVLEQRRAEQRKQWMWSYVNHRLLDIFTNHPTVKGIQNRLERDVMNYQQSPGAGADRLIEEFLKR